MNFSPFSCLFSLRSTFLRIVIFCIKYIAISELCRSVYCLCVNVYCTVLYCTVLYCTVLYCTVLYCTVLYCTAATGCQPNCSWIYRMIHLHYFDICVPRDKVMVCVGKHCKRIWKFEKTKISKALHFGWVQVNMHWIEWLGVVLIGSNIAKEMVRNNLYGILCLESALYYCKQC
jgi:hypothetical protein